MVIFLFSFLQAIELIGKFRLTTFVEEFNQIGHFQKPILQVIKQNCQECCGSNLDKPRNTMDEVKRCQAFSCPMWPYRLGKNPFVKRKLTEQQKKEAAERFAKVRDNRKVA